MTRLSSIIAVALIICSTCSRSFADYVSRQLFDLVGSADVIASGEIIEVRDNTFVLKTDEVLIGKRRENIEIVRFRDWPCAWRWESYKVGQKVLVFAKERDGELHLPGAGGEAESPIVEGHVYCQFPCGLEPIEKHGKREASKIPYADIREAIIGYRSCYQLTPAKNPWRRIGKYKEYFPVDTIKLVCTDSTLAEYAKNSSVHELLVDQTRNEEQRLQKNAP
jgi:hypothetical protein